jgi:hypothetical protein
MGETCLGKFRGTSFYVGDGRQPQGGSTISSNNRRFWRMHARPNRDNPFLMCFSGDFRVVARVLD